MSKNSSYENAVVGLFSVAYYSAHFLGLVVLPFYAIYKDIQNGHPLWAFVDFIAFFPIGTIRGLMYFLGS